MNSRTLTIDILETWSAGSGKGEGSFLDAVPALDADGLPYLPGRTLKGLLREAVLRLEQLGACAAGAASTLFGTREIGQDRYATVPGLLRVNSARLPAAVRAYLQQHPELKAGLFHDVFQTAINDATGVAKSRSLRSARLAVPVQLQADITVIPTVAAPPNFSKEQWDILEAALALFDGVGNGRTRGLGRCIATLAAFAGEQLQEPAHG